MDEQGKKQSGKGILVISIIAIVVVAVLVGVIFFLLTAQNKSDEKRQVLVTEDNVGQVIEEIAQEDEQRENAPGYYTVTMYTEWHFKSGDEPSYDSYVENKEQNTNDVYFDIVMAEDENDVIYKSPIIPRGSSIDSIKLDKVLEPGSYDTICIYNLVDDNQQSLSQVRINLKIIVEG